MPQIVQFITTTGAGTWIVPVDCVSIDKVECIGGGGHGRTNADGGGGGGGGAYSARTAISFSAGQVFDLSVGTGGASSGTAGGDTWFGATTLASSLVGAKGGAGAASSTGAQGGQATAGFPTSGGTRNSGGQGGTGNASVLTGGGGGGAGGPGGDGGAGGNGDATTAGLDCGGGGGSGAGTTTAGGVGAAGTASSGAGGTNASGGGSGGAGNSGAGTAATAATGMWTRTTGGGAATGGGGGGAGSATGAAGAGAAYGGGGGGRGSTTATSAPGGQGIIIITYTVTYIGPYIAGIGPQTTKASTASLNVTYPTISGGILANDIAFAIVVTAGTTNQAITLPDGTWSLMRSNTNGNNRGLKVYGRLMSGGESGTTAWSWAGAESRFVQIIIIRGGNTAQLYEINSISNGTAAITAFTFTSADATKNNSLSLVVAAAWNSTVAPTPPSNYFEDIDSGADATYGTLEVNTQRVNAGTITPSGGTVTASLGYCSTHFIIAPPAVGVPEQAMHYARLRRV